MDAVIVSTTIASVMELDGRVIDPVALKFVVVILVAVKLAGLKFVAAKFVKNAFVDVTEVPVAVVKPKAPESVPPDNSR